MRWNRTTTSLLVLCCGLLAGCQQEMANQPAYRPLEPSTFFPDSRSARPVVAGTVPRGWPLDDDPLLRYTSGNRDQPLQAASALGLAVGSPLAAVGTFGTPPRTVLNYVTAFPFPMTKADLKRGQERYTIFCAVCHDPTGNGRGKIVERGYIQPPSYISDESRGLKRMGIHLKLPEVPAGYYFEVVTRGYGAMPDYASQVPPADRWKIIAYIRALQLSQSAPIDDLPEDVARAAREARDRALEGKR